jgi:hypothetical protein
VRAPKEDSRGFREQKVTREVIDKTMPEETKVIKEETKVIKEGGLKEDFRVLQRERSRSKEKKVLK